jgi:hypothetical protein
MQFQVVFESEFLPFFSFSTSPIAVDWRPGWTKARSEFFGVIVGLNLGNGRQAVNGLASAGDKSTEILLPIKLRETLRRWQSVTRSKFNTRELTNVWLGRGPLD